VYDAISLGTVSQDADADVRKCEAPKTVETTLPQIFKVVQSSNRFANVEGRER
jgi:hypothetical protein